MSNKQKPEYFEQANQWFVDKYEKANIMANRWFAAFLGSILLSALLVIALLCLLPLKTVIPVVVHHNTTTGETWVEKPSKKYAPETEAQTQSDIVRYITNRESYTAADINHRYHLVMLMSSPHVARDYREEQSNTNPKSPVNVLGREGYKTIHIEDIVFIDKEGIEELRHFRQKSVNLAKVDFATVTMDQNGIKHTNYWVATIGWSYKGLPDNKEDAWDNWNGFTVTTYRVDPKNIIKP